MEDLRRALDALSNDHDLAAIGVATAEPFDDERQEIRQRVAEGRSGHLRFTYADPALATDIRSSFAWAERIIVASRAYLPQAGSPVAAKGVGRVARFAVDDPYAPLRQALTEMAQRLIDAGYRAEVLIDDNRLVDRAAAVRAGIVWQGKSSMALDPKHGPWIVLGSVVTDAPLQADVPMSRTCGTCDACIPACPTGAIVEPGVLDARLCLAAWAQTPGTIPVELRSAMGDRVYGCDECLDACPPGNQLLETASEVRGIVDLVEVLGMADAELRSRFSYFYVPKNDVDVVRRNVLVVLGNQRDPDMIGVLAGYLGNPNPVLRSHAGWALGRIGGAMVREVLNQALQDETDPVTEIEIESALNSASPS